MQNQLKLTRRPAEEGDIEFARKAHHQAYRDVIIKQFGEWNEEAQDRFFDSSWKNSTYEILLFNDQLCGYFSIEESEKCITLQELVILPTFQSQGIGFSILNKVIEMAKRKNIPARLQVLKENTAIKLYHKIGFKKVAETKTHFEMEYDPREAE